ncbi:hypothetical protein PLICRDRAFT_180287 [Plicaturopsis crispa FD-325 SS-3]|uniref:Uncharacterized protein n=1 Tax=Plicaturopsis crispa FD-325 SS-3 TaxID=944288 RepID=A0A0C9SQF3_PLICR|nr:hypothetical protein PLICRDRAFT_180287 [Plicaturopsis crispa FD-325 SS-3]
MRRRRCSLLVVDHHVVCVSVRCDHDHPPHPCEGTFVFSFLLVQTHSAYAGIAQPQSTSQNLPLLVTIQPPAVPMYEPRTLAHITQLHTLSRVCAYPRQRPEGGQERVGDSLGSAGRREGAGPVSRRRNARLGRPCALAVVAPAFARVGVLVPAPSRASTIHAPSPSMLPRRLFALAVHAPSPSSRQPSRASSVSSCQRRPVPVPFMRPRRPCSLAIFSPSPSMRPRRRCASLRARRCPRAVPPPFSALVHPRRPRSLVVLAPAVASVGVPVPARRPAPVPFIRPRRPCALAFLAGALACIGVPCQHRPVPSCALAVLAPTPSLFPRHCHPRAPVSAPSSSPCLHPIRSAVAPAPRHPRALSSPRLRRPLASAALSPRYHRSRTVVVPALAPASSTSSLCQSLPRASAVTTS